MTVSMNSVNLNTNTYLSLFSFFVHNTVQCEHCKLFKNEVHSTYVQNYASIVMVAGT